jgi:hypothetical protein
MRRTDRMLLRTLQLGVCTALILLFSGCGSSAGSGGGSSGSQPPPPASFTLSVNPSQLDLSQGTTQTVQVEASSQNGFSGSVTVTTTGLPSGVTASPSTMTLSVGTPSTLSLAASANATSENVQVSLSGVSGALQASASLALDVLQATAPIAVPFTTTGGDVIKGFYDESRQLLFATNLGLNEVDVLAGSNLAVQTRIPVAQPFGIDQMPDGNTLVVGTFTQGFYTIDENTYTVTRYLAPNFSQAGSTMVLLMPVAMANGNVLFAGKDIGVGGADIYIYGAQAIVEWNSATGQFSERYYVSDPNDAIDDLKRSADNNWAVYAADQLYIYSSAGDSFVSSIDPVNSAPFGVRDVAANPDGTQFAVVSAYSASFYDQAFNLLGSVNLGANAGLLFQNNNSQYSADGSSLYWEMFGDQGGGSVVDVLDATNFVEMGNVASNFNIQTQFPPILLWVDSTQQAFFSAGSGGSGELSGVGELSVSTLRSGMPDLAGGVGPNPFVIPLNQSAAVTLSPANSNLPVGTAVTFGGALAPLVSSSPWVVQVPASSVAGPVNVGVTQPDGETLVQPLNFVYGVDVAAPTSTLVPPIGNPTLTLFGYGMLNGPFAAPTVSMNGQTVPNVTVDGEDNYILQGLLLQLPNGTPGPANITVTSVNGTGTLNNAVTYIPSATILPTSSSLVQVLYDTTRSLVYALESNQILVLNPATLQWQAPMVPGGSGGFGYVSMALTPDGSQMMVLDAIANNLTVFDPDTPLQSVTTALTLGNGETPQNVVATSKSKAFIATSGSPLEFDLSSDTYSSTNLFSGEPSRFVAASNGNYVVGINTNSAAGTVALWSTTGASAQGISGVVWTDAAISSNGNILAGVEGAVGYAGMAAGFFDNNLHFTNATVYPDLAPPDQSYCTGALFSASGNTLLSPLADSIDFFNTQTATLQGRLLMPELLPVGNLSTGVIALDPDQETIYATSASGLTVVTLPSTVDQVTPFPWPYVARPRVVPPSASKRPRAFDALRIAKEPARTKTIPGHSVRGTSRGTSR